MPPPPGGGSSRPAVPSAFAAAAHRTQDAHEEGLAASGAAAAATITPCTAASRASFESPRRGGGIVAVPSTVDLEAGSQRGASAPGEPLLEPVALADRITLEFRDVDCYVPRLFGPGAAAGPLARSATLLRRVSSLGSKRSSTGSAKPDAKAPSTRQVRGGKRELGGWGLEEDGATGAGTPARD